MMSADASRRGRGFTLVELMVAILFLSIGIFAYISLQIFLLRHNNKFENSLKAQRVAQIWMNTALYDLVYIQEFQESRLPAISPAELPEGLIEMDITVEDAPDELAPGPPVKTLQRVAVTVEWMEKTGRKSYSITSLVEKGCDI